MKKYFPPSHWKCCPCLSWHVVTATSVPSSAQILQNLEIKWRQYCCHKACSKRITRLHYFISLNPCFWANIKMFIGNSLSSFVYNVMSGDCVAVRQMLTFSVGRSCHTCALVDWITPRCLIVYMTGIAWKRCLFIAIKKVRHPWMLLGLESNMHVNDYPTGSHSCNFLITSLVNEICSLFYSGKGTEKKVLVRSRALLMLQLEWKHLPANFQDDRQNNTCKTPRQHVWAGKFQYSMHYYKISYVYSW